MSSCEILQHLISHSRRGIALFLGEELLIRSSDVLHELFLFRDTFIDLLSQWSVDRFDLVHHHTVLVVVTSLLKCGDQSRTHAVRIGALQLGLDHLPRRFHSRHVLHQTLKFSDDERVAQSTGRRSRGEFIGDFVLNNESSSTDACAAGKSSYRLFAEKNNAISIHSKFLLNDFVGIDGVLNDVHVLLRLRTQWHCQGRGDSSCPTLSELIAQFGIRSFFVVEHASGLERRRSMWTRTSEFVVVPHREFLCFASTTPEVHWPSDRENWFHLAVWWRWLFQPPRLGFVDHRCLQSPLVNSAKPEICSAKTELSIFEGLLDLRVQDIRRFSKAVHFDVHDLCSFRVERGQGVVQGNGDQRSK